MKKIIIDEKEYDLDSVNQTSLNILKNLSQIESRIKETEAMMAVLTKAKRAYISDLKSEMLSTKAGFDFGSD